VPFSYYARLSRAQQAVYRKSDSVTQVRLPRPDELYARVAALAAALESEDRAATQAASERLIRGITDALALPAVRVEVLAARPHARWGEVHGLYTAVRGQRPKIQLWMRTAKQKRVVAFRTYLRTLLHEVGHHIDYAHLGLQDSFHTEGFYKRESSLFYQLVPRRTASMLTVDDYLKQPGATRLTRLARTPDEVGDTIAGKAPAALARRPGARSWAPVEIVCHLRDAEELFMLRFQTILAMETPALHEASSADRWAEERQYLRHQPGAALEAFRRRRAESLELLTSLPPADWQRGAIHPARGRVSIDELVAIMAWHDDNHLDQLIRAVEGTS
jgi:hypothetical protein